MKKYILLLVTALSFAQASNQMVTFTQAQSLGFVLKSGQSSVNSNQCMTKEDILAKYNVTISGYTDNQLVPKSAWANAVAYYTYNISFSATEGSESNATCYSYSLPYAVYSGSSTVQTGINLYTNTALTIPYMGRNQTYYHAETNQLISISDSGLVTGTTTCQQTYYYSYLFSESTSRSDLSCGLQLINTYYSSIEYLDVGVILYTNTGLTSPLVGNNRWYYTDSGESFKVNNSGVIIEQYNCF